MPTNNTEGHTTIDTTRTYSKSLLVLHNTEYGKVKHITDFKTHASKQLIRTKWTFWFYST